MSAAVSFLQREAAEAARIDHELSKAYTLAARLSKTAFIREQFEAMAIEARLSSLSWMRLANFLWLSQLIGGEG